MTYTNTAPNLDTLTSVGYVPTGTQRRRIVVSNFTSFLMSITLYWHQPLLLPITGQIPPIQLRKLLPRYAGGRSCHDDRQSGVPQQLLSGNAGNQIWTTEAAQSQTNCTIRLFWCRFNGTWSANPSVNFSGTTCNTVVMHVFRPSNTSSVWQVDVAQVSGPSPMHLPPSHSGDHHGHRRSPCVCSVGHCG